MAQRREVMLLLLGVALFPVVVGDAVPAKAADPVRRPCVEACKRGRQACIGTAADEFGSFWSACGGLGTRKEIKQCRKAQRRAFDANRRTCKRWSSQVCRQCCQASSKACTGEAVAGHVASGGILTTDTEEDGATASDQSEVWVRSPNLGYVSIVETLLPVLPVQGFRSLDPQFFVTAPDATSIDPLVLTFQIDASQVPTIPAALRIFRDEEGRTSPLGTCTHDGLASPDPCVGPREPALIDGDARITVFTSKAGRWTARVPVGPCGETVSSILSPRAQRR